MKNIGIIGIGYWGPNYVRVINELSSTDKSICLYACCDIDQNKLNIIKRTLGRNNQVKMVSDYKELLSDPKIDAIIISTSASTHYDIAKNCLEAQKDILVEKPLTLSVKEAKELIKIANSTNRILMVGHTFQFNPAVQNMKQRIDRGEIGKIYYIHSSRMGLGPIRRDVNVLWDFTAHDIYILLYLLNNEIPIEVTAIGQSYIQNDMEDVVFLNIKFTNNIIGNVQASWIYPLKVRKTTVVGDKKMIIFDDVDNIEKIKIFDKSIEAVKRTNSYGDYILELREGDIHIPKIENTEPLKNEVVHFLDCIINRKTPITDGYNGLEVIKIIEAAQMSLKNNGIMIPLKGQNK